MERIFLGNNRPLLHLTEDYLIDRYYKKGQLDLRNVILALQEQRAINRLEEILASGQIDRIDRHRGSGALIILDYKTGASAHPNQHLHKEEWIDFQLPLYYYLLSQHQKDADNLRRTPQLGYIVLPSNVSKTGEVLADWDGAMLDSAIDEARTIVESIWDDAFEMVSPAPKFSEAFSAICGDF